MLTIQHDSRLLDVVKLRFKQSQDLFACRSCVFGNYQSTQLDIWALSGPRDQASCISLAPEGFPFLWEIVNCCQDAAAVITGGSIDSLVCAIRGHSKLPDGSGCSRQQRHGARSLHDSGDCSSLSQPVSQQLFCSGSGMQSQFATPA